MARQRKGRRKRVWKDWTPRQPTGEGGALVSEYPKATIRLPPDVLELLEQLANGEQRPRWRVLVDAIRDYAEAKGKPPK